MINRILKWLINRFSPQLLFLAFEISFLWFTFTFFPLTISHLSKFLLFSFQNNKSLRYKVFRRPWNLQSPQEKANWWRDEKYHGVVRGWWIFFPWIITQVERNSWRNWLEKGRWGQRKAAGKFKRQRKIEGEISKIYCSAGSDNKRRE